MNAGFVTRPGVRRAAAGVLTLTLGLYVYFGGQPVAAGLLGAYDKLGHFALYAVITGLLWLAASGRRPWTLLCVIALAGLADEWRQSLLPGRFADAGDWVTDVVAGAMVLLLLSRVPRTARRNLW